MAKNQSCAYSEGVCSKICKAIRRISHRRPSSKYPNSDSETAKATSSEIPTDFSTLVQESPQSAKAASRVEQIASGQGHVHVIRVTTEENSPPVKAFTGGVDQGRRNYSKVEKVQAKEEEGRKYNRTDSEFTNYIDHTKKKLATTSTMGGGGGAVGGGGGRKGAPPRLDSINDKVTNYINRAKIKLRTKSSLSTGRSISIK